MVYIYALLLIPSSISKIPGRVVFSNTLPINNFQSTIRNDVYKLSNSEFPKPEDNSGIFMAIDDSRTPGTHHAVYSAPNMPYADMIARIMGGASPLTDEQVINLDKDAIAVQECHQYLQSKAQEVDTVMPLRSRTPRAFVWYQGRPHLVFGCIEDKRAWFITSTIMGRRERRSLDGAILLVNNRYGKKESLVKKSRLGIELDLKRYSKINPTVDPYTNGRVSIVRLSNPPEKMPGVLVDWYDCLSYKSSSPKLFDWGARSKPS
ncbi:BgTH12-00380 [Blumeria graminis f. sp. triticale]|uniref:BgTH12-00380 n=1 Tax=Blumeria graminis f. sp. triticale TaxID=1689686 RepID=A0A9W4GGQ7_BLUGR|nr:BgTH12-00380 [Blumeria graminis f. sp. triticale]